MSDLKVREVYSGRVYTMEEAITASLFSPSAHYEGELERLRSDVEALKRIIVEHLFGDVGTVDKLNEIARYSRFEKVEEKK